MTAEEAAWMAWRDDPRPLGWFIPRDERAFKDGYRAARVEAFADIRRGVEAAPVLMREMFGSGDDRTVTDLIDRADVLALLPSVPPEEKP